jgi:hypothetical protein
MVERPSPFTTITRFTTNDKEANYYNGFHLLPLEDAALHEPRILLLWLAHAQRGVAAVEHDVAAADLGRKSEKKDNLRLHRSGLSWTFQVHNS